MSLFLGIGLGPIQTSIFLSGAVKGGFDRIVAAEVDPRLVNAVRAHGSISINIAEASGVRQERYEGVEIYNPNDPADQAPLLQAASESSELATALPNVSFFRFIAPWLRKGFALDPKRTRFIYAAENHNRAAELLQEALGDEFPNTRCLNTVVGKMCKACACSPAMATTPLCPSLETGYLVEAFDSIYISSAPGIEGRRCAKLLPKDDLLPFEEAKLYGHNAIHFMLGWEAAKAGLSYMSELAESPALLEQGRQAFLCESGAALLRKWGGMDDLFTENGFKAMRARCWTEC